MISRSYFFDQLGRWFCIDLSHEKLKESRRQYRLGIKESKQEYYLQNKEILSESKQQYYLRNKDKMKESKRQYQLENKVKLKESKQHYYLLNKDNINETNRKYYRENLDKLKEQDRLNRLRIHKDPTSYLPRKKPMKSWRTPELVRDYLNSIASALSITDESDWYRVSRSQIVDLGGGSLLATFGNLGTALKFAYPSISWDMSKFTVKGKKSEQRLLKVKLQELLPGVEIIEEPILPELSWQSDETEMEKPDRQVELDLWIPKYRIGIEYQGEQHYFNLESAFGANGTSTLYSERDTIKHSLCRQQGITLIPIPFWWDGGSTSLSNILSQSRPDVFPVKISDPRPE